jgi:hypothetical protein
MLSLHTELHGAKDYLRARTNFRLGSDPNRKLIHR